MLAQCLRPQHKSDCMLTKNLRDISWKKLTSKVTGKLIGIKLLKRMKNVRKVKPKFCGFRPMKRDINRENE